jgi:hypothetical protein
MINSKYKVAEQLSFSLDVTQAIGNLADKLVEVENEQTLKFLAPLSSLIAKPRAMTLILPGIYSIGRLLSADFTHEEVTAVRNLYPTQATSNIMVFRKLYFHDTVLHSSQQERKRDSCTCCYTFEGMKNYGVITKFCFSPPIVLLKPYKRTASSLLRTAGNPGRECLKEYAKHDLLGAFVVKVSDLLPVCAVPISSLLCKCAHISCHNPPNSYVVHIPNNFEHT